MAKQSEAKDSIKFNESAKSEIIENLMKRVRHPLRRSKIIALANEFSDEGDDEQAFYSAVYHYALRENWPELERDFEEFCSAGPEPRELVEKRGTPSRGIKRRKTGRS